jgi:NifB/MoaA-like Fe-S oxidoreductase
MNEKQAEQIIDLLKKLVNRVSAIETNTDVIMSELSDIHKKIS